MLQDMIYSQQEKEFFQFLFNSTKNPNQDFIEGREVASLFKKANLPIVIVI